MSSLGLALSVLIGVSLGFFGGGGSILTVPLLVYVFGLEPKQAIASSLLIVGVASISGAYQHWRAGNVELRTAMQFGAAGMAGSYLGARAGAFVDGTLLLLLFAAMMVLTSLAMWRGRRAASPATARDRAISRLLMQGFGVGPLHGARRCGRWLPDRAGAGALGGASHAGGRGNLPRHHRAEHAGGLLGIREPRRGGLRPRRLGRPGGHPGLVRRIAIGRSDRSRIPPTGVRGLRARDGDGHLRARDGHLARDGAERRAPVDSSSRLRPLRARGGHRRGSRLAPGGADPLGERAFSEGAGI